MRRSVYLSLCLSMVCCVMVYKSTGAKSSQESAERGAVTIALREGPSAEWHHSGDDLLITYAGETLLRIQLDMSSEQAVPFRLNLGSKGRILMWADDFDDASLGMAEKRFTLFRADGAVAQQYRTILWATYDLGNGQTGSLRFALPEEGYEFWVLERTSEKEACLTRAIDPQYMQLLRRGGGYAGRAGISNSTAMNCALHVSFGGRFREYYVNLPWPIINP